MIEIASLSPGDIVRNLGSGRVYVVSDVPRPYMPTTGAMYWAVSLLNGPECSNPQEWELYRQAEQFAAQLSDTCAGEYAIETTIHGEVVRYSAPDAMGVAELMRVYSEHVMGLGVDVESP